ncbi:MAG: type I-C CRISPR-associated protein Cas7/Csd2 [Parachlamydiaceae bacterium]
MTINHRYEFVYLFEVTDGNPNGDPDAGNLPRVDAETGQGLVTDVCLKRKIRNFVSIVKNNVSPYEIYVKEKAILNDQHDRAYVANDFELKEDKKNKKNGDKVDTARQWMCKNFFDVRTFGAVMSTGDNKCGQVRGPIQMTFARSIDPIISSEHTITRMAVATKAEAEKQDNDNRTMGRKHTVPYGLYRCHGFISAHLADQVGFNEQDLELFWDALKNMFDHDHSASRGLMSARGLYIFKHDSALGNASAHKLFDCIKVQKKEGVTVPREFSHYEILIDQNQIPQNVNFINVI